MSAEAALINRKILEDQKIKRERRASASINRIKPQADEIGEINRLIAASKNTSAREVLNDRRRTKSTEIASGELPEASTSPKSVMPAVPEVSTHKQDKPAFPPGLPPKPPTSTDVANGMAKMRWLNAISAHAGTRKTSDDVADDSDPANLYQLLKSQSQQHLSGAAARGARAAALSRVKQATSAVGGKFLSAEEWQVMRAELGNLRVQNKRLEKEVASLRAAAARTEQAHEDDRVLVERLSEGGPPGFLSRVFGASPALMRSSGGCSPSAKRPAA